MCNIRRIVTYAKPVQIICTCQDTVISNLSLLIMLNALKTRVGANNKWVTPYSVYVASYIQYACMCVCTCIAILTFEQEKLIIIQFPML